MSLHTTLSIALDDHGAPAVVEAIRQIAISKADQLRPRDPWRAGAWSRLGKQLSKASITAQADRDELSAIPPA